MLEEVLGLTVIAAQEDLGRMIEKFGSTQFFFGSDYPMWNANEELQRLEKMHLPENIRRGIEYQNFLDFLDRHNE